MWHGSWLIMLWHCSTHVSSSSDMTGGESEPSPLEGCWVGLVWHHRLYLYGFLAAVFGTWLSLKMAFSKRSSCAEVVRQRRSGAVEDESSAAGSDPVSVQVSAVKILYGSQTGTAQGFAKELAEEVRSLGIAAEVINLKDYDPDDRLAEECTNRSVCVFLLATYTDGQPTENADWFCKWLEDASTDFRYGKTYLKGLRYAVFGLGHSAYVGHYNTVSRNVDKWLWMLSGTRLLTRGSGDCNVAKSRSGSVQGDFLVWKVHFLSRLRALADRGETRCCSGDGGCKSHAESCKNQPKDIPERGGGGGGGAEEEQQQQQEEAEEEAEVSQHDSSEEEEEEEEEEEMLESSSDEESAGPGENKSVVDVEDLGDIMSGLKRTKSAGQSQAGGQMVRRSKSNGAMRKGEEEEERREMITPALRQALTKQGYKLIGSHSGVKLCRWTKSMLRGRGGCYKHTFYGIESHRCMETTPSLACANKCVFCWRHHTNPVGTEWRWKMDPAEKILQEALDNHQSMIRQFRGVPGVKPARYEEGLAAKHCALSLVGEPIMYPEINAFLRLLHAKRISSFLVTNAQFPQEIRSLVPVTQLYVSVDASTKDSLKKIDRPLFRDFWPRFLDSLKALGEKGTGVQIIGGAAGAAALVRCHRPAAAPRFPEPRDSSLFISRWRATVERAERGQKKQELMEHLEKMPFHHVTAGLLYKGNYLSRSLSESDSDVLASISVEELDEIREAFRVLDRDGNGFISKQELGMAMRSLGYMPSEVELAIIMQRLDMDGDGQVDFEEFMTILGPKLLSSETREGFLGSTIDTIFWQFDMQRITLEELKHILFHAFRDHLTMKDIENIIINEEESLKENSGNCVEFEGVHPSKKNRQTCVRKSLICAFAMAFIISVMLIAANQMLRNGME
ncbi:unnamed protein product [Merluccius merluccius]